MNRAVSAQRWTAEEKEILKANYHSVTDEEIARLLPNRTAEAIYKKAYKLGYKKSEENKFANRSNARKREKSCWWRGGIRFTAKGYKQIKQPDHPRADRNGYVMEHIVIWEKINNQRVPEGYVIHHINQNKEDNRPENLKILTNAEHTALHSTGRKLSQEAKQKMSEHQKNRFKNKENHPRYRKIDLLQMQSMIQSGKTVKQTCEEYGINKSTYYKKIKKGEYIKE